jgi:hypothetical protein
MRSTAHGRERIDALFDELEAALRRCSELSFDALTSPELWALLERYERPWILVIRVSYRASRSRRPTKPGSSELSVTLIRRPLQYPVTFGDLREVVVVALARCALFLAYW